jgi:hypothetical protein
VNKVILILKSAVFNVTIDERAVLQDNTTGDAKRHPHFKLAISPGDQAQLQRSSK